MKKKWPSFERAWHGNNDLPKEIFSPSAGWAEDSKCHYLLIQLFGFKQDEIKIQVEYPDHIKIVGQRNLGNKILFINKTYKIPDNNIDINSASGKLDRGVFTVTIRKKAAVTPPLMLVNQQRSEEEDEHIENQSDTNPTANYNVDMNKDQIHQVVTNRGETSEVEENEKDSKEISHRFNGAAEAINKNKGMIFTLLTAFTLGMLVSRKVESRSRSNSEEHYGNLINHSS